MLFNFIETLLKFSTLYLFNSCFYYAVFKINQANAVTIFLFFVFTFFFRKLKFFVGSIVKEIQPFKV